MICCTNAWLRPADKTEHRDWLEANAVHVYLLGAIEIMSGRISVVAYLETLRLHDCTHNARTALCPNVRSIAGAMLFQTDWVVNKSMRQADMTWVD